jgi:hypothetical protein
MVPKTRPAGWGGRSVAAALNPAGSLPHFLQLLGLVRRGSELGWDAFLDETLTMTVQALHPILYVADPDAERNFFERFGFTTTYEGDEFPGFLALGSGDVRFGVSQSKTLPPKGGHDGVRWQLIVDDVDQIAAICADASFPCEIVVETGGDTHRARIAKVTSPNGVVVWFEGPNEIAQPLGSRWADRRNGTSRKSSLQ